MKSGLNGIDGADSWCPNTPGIKGGNGDTMVCYVNSKLLFTNIGGYGGTGGFSIYNRDPSPGTPGGDGDINFFSNAISGGSIEIETSFGNPAYGLYDFEISNSLIYKGINTSGRILLMY